MWNVHIFKFFLLLGLKCNCHQEEIFTFCSEGVMRWSVEKLYNILGSFLSFLKNLIELWVMTVMFVHAFSVPRAIVLFFPLITASLWRVYGNFKILVWISFSTFYMIFFITCHKSVQSVGKLQPLVGNCLLNLKRVVREDFTEFQKYLLFSFSDI